VKCAPIYFCENRSWVCFVVLSCCILVVNVGENPEATTSSRFFNFHLRLCKAGRALQPKGGEH
jgi:hypothetical protein